MGNHPGISIDRVVTLSRAPEMKEGWGVGDISTTLGRAYFTIPAFLQGSYDEFSISVPLDKHQRNIALRVVTKGFTDCPSITADFERTYYSYNRFFQTVVSKDASQAVNFITSALDDGNISFSNAACVHIVVETSDSGILMTRRSTIVDLYPGSWSCSIEERLSEEDFSDTRPRPICRCVRRALVQELGIESDSFALENLRILSFFLETDILGVSVCAIVRLNLDSHELEEKLNNGLMQDLEFTEYKICKLNDLGSLLYQSSADFSELHPTTRYRIVMTMIHHFGEAEFVHRLQEHILGNSPSD